MKLVKAEKLTKELVDIRRDINSAIQMLTVCVRLHAKTLLLMMELDGWGLGIRIGVGTNSQLRGMSDDSSDVDAQGPGRERRSVQTSGGRGNR